MPDSKKADPKEDWQYRTDFTELHGDFPGLVDANGGGWFYRHVHGICDFVSTNPTLASKTAQDGCAKLEHGFGDAWRRKVIQYQIPIFSPATKGAWVLRFDDILADALELGQLRKHDIVFPACIQKKIISETPKDVPTEVIELLIKYYTANKPEDSDWVVLPVTNFDAYFGNTNFSRKWLNRIPERIIIRQKQSFGVCRYRVVSAVFK